MAERRDRRDSPGHLALIVLAASLVFQLACSSASSRQAETASTPSAPPTVATTAQVRTPASIESLDLSDDGSRAAIALRADRPLVWTSFRNADGDLVVELPNSMPASAVADLAPATGLIAALDVERLDDAERPLTRLVVRTRQPSEHSLTGEGSELRLQLLPIDSAQDVTLAYEPLAEEEPAAEPAMMATEPIAAQETAIVAEAPPAEPVGVPQTFGTPDQPQLGPPPSGVVASQLYGVEVDRAGAGTLVRVTGDGEFTYSTFRLENPERFVIDLDGVVNNSARSTVSVGSPLVDQIRIGQFKPRPEPVSRVVFDLSDYTVPSVSQDGDGLIISFGGAEPERVTTLAQDISEPYMAEPTEDASEPVTAPEPAPEPVEMVADVDETPEYEAPAVEETVAPTPTYEPPTAEAPTYVAQTAPAPPAAASVPVYQPVPESVAAPAIAGDVSQFEAQQVEVTDSELKRERLLESFGSLVISRQEKEYVGEPISMSLRNADLVETLRSFAKLSDLNFVIQPGVRGSVTVELKLVPWDQAMEQILKINNLGMDIDGTIVRIAPTPQLRREAEEQRRLAQARQRSVPLRTVMRSLSYSKASQVARLLRSRTGAILSRRGTVQVDARTNTLIIRELPDNIDTILAVIDNLDTPEPQVTIEARIIEATKNFSRSLGILWNFDYEGTPENGNTTGLVFPNSVEVDGGVGLLTGGANGFMNLTLGNILDTFELNASIQAAEAEGLVNIVSAPRITTLNNNSASIQSGLQIPIQTVSDRTVSVQFINATLNLTVTPQVTAEGTVLMDINVAKRTPQLALAVVGATNAPIATKEARTKVIVRDGGTAVIGGIYEVQSNQNQDRVPGLANVPILGHLFKNRNRTDSNDELMIFITPRIVQL